MLAKPSLILRITIGKSIGFIVGLMFFFLAPIYGESDVLFRMGVVLWFTTMGAFVGLFGVMTEYPIIHLPLPWWFRGPLIGSFMMLVLWLVAHERMDAMVVNIMGEGAFISSGLWTVADGGFLGLIMAWFATKFGGEGRATVGY